QNKWLITNHDVGQVVDPTGVSLVQAFGFDGNDAVYASVNVPCLISGGDGNDTIGSSGSGRDSLFGDAGDDSFGSYQDLRRDLLYGGDGKDSALFDRSDLTFDIERRTRV